MKLMSVESGHDRTGNGHCPDRFPYRHGAAVLLRLMGQDKPAALDTSAGKRKKVAGD